MHLRENFTKFLPTRERVQQRTAEHVPMIQILQETLEVAVVPFERVQQRTAPARASASDFERECRRRHSGPV